MPKENQKVYCYPFMTKISTSKATSLKNPNKQTKNKEVNEIIGWHPGPLSNDGE